MNREQLRQIDRHYINLYIRLLKFVHVLPLQPDGYKLFVLLTLICEKEDFAISSFNARSFEIHFNRLGDRFNLIGRCEGLCCSYYIYVCACMQVSKVFS